MFINYHCKPVEAIFSYSDYIINKKGNNMAIAQTALDLATQSENGHDYRINARDREVLRGLAARVADIAARPEQAEKREAWRSLNGLKPKRAVVFCDPENGWNEIITPADMRCENTLARQWEMTLRREVFWGAEMGDDRVVDAVFNVTHVFKDTGWGMEERKIGGTDGGSYRWEAPLRDYALMDKLRFPEVIVDYEATDRVLDLAKDVFKGLLSVRLKTKWWWTQGMTMTLVKLRGLEQILMDMYDEPENLKRLMAFLRDGHMRKLDFLEQNGLLSLNGDNTYVGSGGFGFTDELPAAGYKPDHVRTQDMWGFGESQETGTVSPDMFAEFVLPYQLPILERFGLNCYGCCEPLDVRWHYVKTIPRLRRVSVSTWADPERMAAFLGPNYVFSAKPNPAHLALPKMNEEAARAEVKRIVQAAKKHGCCLELVMKDNHTLGRNPRNAIRWCQIAREESAKL